MNLIMISAMYENGGNTTHRILDGHPELFVYPFESQLGTGQANDYLASFVPIRYRWPEVPTEGSPAQDYELFWDEELKTYLRVPNRSKFDGCGLEMEEAERKRLFSEYLIENPRNRRNIVLAFFSSAIGAWTNIKRTGSEKAFLGYNPVQVLDAVKFFEDFPDGHMLHVVRNPFSGYADTKRRPFPLSLSRYAWTWSLCQLMALTYRDRFEGHFHLVRYEDLVSNVESALAPVLNRMGLEWSETCTYPSFNGQKLEKVYPWGTIRTPTSDANMKTMQELSAEEIADLASLTRVLLPPLQYEDLVGG